MQAGGEVKRLSLIAALSLCASGLTGCVSYYSDAPAFQALTPPQQHGVIYVMRPTSQFGMLQYIKAELDEERFFYLYPGSYGAFYVPPGKVKLRIVIETWGSAGIFGPIAVTTSEFDPKVKEVEVDVAAGGAVYIKTSVDGWKVPPEAEPVSRPKRSLRLAAGGCPRLPHLGVAGEAPPHAPTPAVVSASPAAPSPAPTPATPAYPPVPAPPPPPPPKVPELVAGVARAAGRFEAACKPNPAMAGTCVATTEEAKRELSATRAAAEPLRSLALTTEQAKRLAAFTSMLEAVEADVGAGRPVNLSKVGALIRTTKDLGR